MEANGKPSKTGEIRMTENKTGNVVLTISEEVEASKNPTPGTPKDAKPRGVSIIESPHRKSDDISPENAHFMPNPNKPPKTPNPETLTRLNSVAALVYSKPKSRFGEQPIIEPNMFDDMPEPVGQTSNSPMTSPGVAGNTTSSPFGTPSKGTPRSLSIDPKTPLMASPRGDDDDDDDDDKEIHNKVNMEKQLKLKRVKMKVLFHRVLLLFLVGCIVASITTPKLENYKICSVKLWKWFVLITVIIYGMLVTDWLIRFIILLIELNFIMKKKVLYYVYGVKKSVQVCIWFIGILVTWELLFKTQNAVKSETTTKIFDYITWTNVALLIGSVLWVLKNLLLVILPTSFHVRNFFDRIQESIFLQYVLLTLSGPPILESYLNIGERTSKSQTSVIDISKLQQIKKEKVSTWTMRILGNTITNRGLSTVSGEFEESAYYGSGVDKEITSEMEAIAAAYDIFRNVAQHGVRYIDDLDLRRFMIKEEVDIVFPMIDVGDKGKIDRRTLTEWVVKVYNKRKALAHALDDTKTTVNEINKLVSAVLIVIMIIVWLLLTEIATTKVLVLISSQLVVAAFIFGNTCKTVFEAIIFVFIMHPFHVGDRCVVDGVQMVVEEMNILGTVFLKFDNEMIYYPNSVLATKPISNFYRSPDMGDNVEFSIDFATPFEKIELLKNKIRKYLKKNPRLWYANHNFVVKEIENENKIKMALLFNHKMNFQDYDEKNKRRGELILELKKTFEELKIKCYLVPQEVHMETPTTPAPSGSTE